MPYNFSELGCVDELQEMADALSATSSIAARIHDPRGQIIVASGLEDIWSCFYRKHPVTSEMCEKCRQRLLENSGSGGEYLTHRCPQGFTVCSSPVRVQGQHVATVITGPVLIDNGEGFSKEMFRQQAQRFEFDEELYLEYLEQVPVLAEKNFRSAASCFAKMTGILFRLELATDTEKNLQHQHFMQQVKTKEARRRSEDITRQLLELYTRAPDLSDRGLYEFVLDKAVELTGSTIGFFHLVSDDQQTISLTTWNAQTLKNCKAVYDAHYPLSAAGNWVDCIREKRPVIYNDFPASPNQKGLPEGHTPLARFMSVPVMEGDKVRYIFGVGNKTGEYEKNDSDQILLIANELHKILVQRTARKENKKLEEQLHQAQKMEMVGRLAGGVAHDFNNLLTVISGNVELAQMDLEPGNDLHGYLDEVSAAADRAAELTHQLLAFSRKQIIMPRVINLNHLIENMMKMLKRIIGEDIDLRPLTNRRIGQIKADPGQMEQVIVNMAVNARDAMPQGGTLTIETSELELDGEYCRDHLHVEPGMYAMLAISDNGSGMDEETRKHIFDPFFTTKKEGKGTGLGLSTVYGIIKQHGGNIEVYSESEAGTTFKVYLPLVDEQEEHIRIQAEPVIRQMGIETILLVEDEAIVRRTARRILKRMGYTVLEADNGLAALEAAQKFDGTIDLLLTDVVMPKMNGRQLAQEMQRQYPGIKILFASGYTDNVIAHHGILDEGLNFIGKPYSTQGLAQRVRSVLDQ